ncbi:MAG: FG-GAP repeat protein, partial [Planctomycetes bacterium]|nr:FG-GAP repeat protein [Planctomycetota bacterium]
MRIHHTSPRKLPSLLVALLCITVSAAEASGQCEVTPIPVGDGSTSSFNTQVDLDGDIAVIGDLSDDRLGSYSGSVKVRRFNGTVWVEEAVLTASNGGAQDQFGTQVAVSGNVIAVGSAPWQLPDNPGAAYIFRYNIAASIWEEEAILTRQTPAPTVSKNFFGVNIALDRDVVVIAGTTINGTGEDIMGAHIFR